MLETIILLVAPELSQMEFDTLLPLVSIAKQKRIKQFRFFRDAQNCLLGDVLARTEICRVTGLSNKQLEFSANEYGKPYLTKIPHIHFNISHTDHYVTCVIDNQPVGIDIEIIKPIELKIAERFFSPDEVAYILSSTEKLTFQHFYEVWTKKESRIKWEGKGLSRPWSSFSVFDSVRNDSVLYHLGFQDDETICHVCSAKREPPSVRFIDTIAFMGYVK